LLIGSQRVACSSLFGKIGLGDTDAPEKSVVTDLFSVVARKSESINLLIDVAMLLMPPVILHLALMFVLNTASLLGVKYDMIVSSGP